MVNIKVNKMKNEKELEVKIEQSTKLYIISYQKDSVLINHSRSGLLTPKSAVQLWVISHLHPSRFSENGYYESEKKISEKLGVSEKTVFNAIEDAEQKNWFTRTGHNGINKRQYIIGKNLIYIIDGKEITTDLDLLNIEDCIDDFPVGEIEENYKSDNPLLNAKTGDWKKEYEILKITEKKKVNIEKYISHFFDVTLKEDKTIPLGEALKEQILNIQKECGIKEYNDNANKTDKQIKNWAESLNYDYQLMKELVIKFLNDCKNNHSKKFIGKHLCNNGM
jgi:DNA-binding CsgD family transcriptional regulator